MAELTRLLKQSIARRMVSDVPFGVLLSGGVDSSLNVALMSELMNRPGHHVHDRLRGQGRLQRVRVRAPGEPPIRHRSSRDAHQPPRDAGVPAAARAAAGRADCRQRLHPAVFPVAPGQAERHDRRPGRRGRRRELSRLLVVRALSPEVRAGLQAGGREAELVGTAARAGEGDDARRERRGSGDRQPRPERAGAVLGRRRVLVGRAARAADAEHRAVSAIDRLPGRGTPSASHRTLDSHAVVEHYLGSLTGHLREPEVLQKIPTWR